MASLGEQTAGEILRKLPEDDVSTLTHAVARLSGISSDQAESVLEEFQRKVAERRFVTQGGLEYAAKMMRNAFGEEVADKMLSGLALALENDGANLEVLQKADPQQLVKFIHNEHPQTIALVLSRLSPNQAATLLTSLPQSIRATVALRMANLDQISPAIVNKIATVIGQKMSKLGDVSRISHGGVRVVTEMINRLDSSVSAGVLEEIEREDPHLYETIRHLMFVFEDLLTIDAVGIKEVLARADRKVLTLALKGTSEKLREHIMKNMSQRGAEMMKEDMDAMGPVKIRDVEGAQQQLVALVRQLEQEDVLVLGGGADDAYVV